MRLNTKVNAEFRALLVGLCLSAAGSMGTARAENFSLKAWGLQAGYGIEASRALAEMKSKCHNSKVVVAIIDTGLDATHPALKNSLWKNPGELNGKPGVDDDKNGFVDDVHGWDFVRNSPVLIDSHGHGTHIAGIISGNTEGGTDQYKGVCPGVQVMALRYYDPNGSGDDNLKNTIKAINYAVDRGVNLINYSGGGAEFSREEFNALKKAEQKGILVVAAAGNERSNADKKFYYPAAYDLKNILSVTALDERGKVLPSSNFGVQKVHVAAPGQSILSSVPGSGYGFMTGTSQATAYVSGIAAMLFTENITLSFEKVKSLIEDSAKRYPQLSGKTKTGAEANALAAVQLLRGARGLSSQPEPLGVVAADQLEVIPQATQKVPAQTPKVDRLLMDRIRSR